MWGIPMVVQCSTVGSLLSFQHVPLTATVLIMVVDWTYGYALGGAGGGICVYMCVYVCIYVYVHLIV